MMAQAPPPATDCGACTPSAALSPPRPPAGEVEKGTPEWTRGGGSSTSSGSESASESDGGGESSGSKPAGRHDSRKLSKKKGMKRAGGGRGSGARVDRGGDGVAPTGLSEKTLQIMSNLEIHSKGVGALSREEQDEIEEERKLAEEEKLKAQAARSQKAAQNASSMQSGSDPELTIRILLLGDSGVGKTSLLHRYSEDKFHPTLISSAGVDFKVRHMDILGRKVRCQVWDTAGQEKFHVITRAYYRGAHGIALVYDVTDSDSFKNVNYWMANIQTHASNVQMTMMGNKVDLAERQISTSTGEELAGEFELPFFEVSAKSGSGVTEAFTSLAERIVARIDAESQGGAPATLQKTRSAGRLPSVSTGGESKCVVS